MTQLVTLRRHGFQSRHGQKECSNIANLKRVAADRKRKQDCAQQQHGHEHEARHMRRFSFDRAEQVARSPQPATAVVITF